MGACFFLGRWALWAYELEGSVVGTLRPSFCPSPRQSHSTWSRRPMSDLTSMRERIWLWHRFLQKKLRKCAPLKILRNEFVDHVAELLRAANEVPEDAVTRCG